MPAAQQADTIARPTDEAAPVLKNIDGPALAGAIGADGSIKLSGDGMAMGIRLPPLAPAILRQVNGTRSIAEIRAATGAGDEDFQRQFAALYHALNGMNQMLLRYPG